MRELYRRVRTLWRLATLLRVDDSGAVQVVQVKTGPDETLSDVECRYPYGYTANPLKEGADPIVVALNGNPAHSLVIMVGNRKYRLKGLAEGEVALYDDQGQQIILKRDKIQFNAPLGYEFNGVGTFNGNTSFIGQVFANGKRIDETHGHSGVEPGPGTSGGVV